MIYPHRALTTYMDLDPKRHWSPFSASKYADEIVLMHDGRIYAYGKPSDIITSENLLTVYGVKSDILESEGRPHVILKDEGLSDFDID